MTQIVAICGSKQSGKTSCINFLHGHTLKCSDKEGKFNYSIKDTGELAVTVTDSEGNESEGGLDINQKSMKFVEWAEWRVWPLIKAYHFAETLKDICVEVLGLSWEQVHGTDAEKNSFTHLRWEDMPGVIITQDSITYDEIFGGLDAHGMAGDFTFRDNGGAMTAREVMQYVGTDIFRKMYTNVWVDQVLRQIVNDSQVYDTQLAVIGDCRFTNEVEAVQQSGGRVIYLTRNIDDNPTHASENDLAGYTGFDAVIDNRNLSIHETHDQLLDILVGWELTERPTDRRGVTSCKRG